MSWSGQALQSAGFSLEPGSFEGLDLAKCGILIGTAMGGMATFSNAVEDLTQKVSPNKPLSHSVSKIIIIYAYFSQISFTHIMPT